MRMTSVFTNNRSQAVRLPADVRLPEGMKKLQVRARGVDRIISPAGHTWDEFFLNGPKASHDCLVELDAIKRRPLEVIGVFNENAGRMAITAITLSELFHGAEKIAKLAQNLAVVLAGGAALHRQGFAALWRHPQRAREGGPNNRRKRSAHRRPCPQRGADAGDEKHQRIRKGARAADSEPARGGLTGGDAGRQVGAPANAQPD